MAAASFNYFPPFLKNLKLLNLFVLRNISKFAIWIIWSEPSSCCIEVRSSSVGTLLCRVEPHSLLACWVHLF